MLFSFCLWFSSLTCAYSMSQCPGFFQFFSKAAAICVGPQRGGHLLEACRHLAQGCLCPLAFVHLSLSGLNLHHGLPPAIHYHLCADRPKIQFILDNYSLFPKLRISIHLKIIVKVIFISCAPNFILYLCI